MALACGSPFYQPPKSIMDMAHDLSDLPLWYKNEPEDQLWNTCQLPLDLNYQADTMLHPWGWNLALLRQATLQKIGYLPSAEDIRTWQKLSHRTVAAQLLKKLTNNKPYCCGESTPLYTVEEAKAFVAAHPHSILKAPWSGSGRGLQTISFEISPPIQHWCQHIIKAQRCIMGEPLYNKIQDFAMEFYCQHGIVCFTGYSLFRTNGYHVYTGNVLASDEAIETFLQSYLPLGSLPVIRKELCILLTEILANSHYQGYLGVDMMICLSQNKYLLHPCVEINLRMNMGMVARILHDRYAAPGSNGYYNIDYFSHTELLQEYHSEMMKKYPIRQSKGLYVKGYVSLTPVTNKSKYQAMMLFTEHPEMNLLSYFNYI